MKAIVKAHAGVGLEMREVPEPTLKDNEVLIKIHKTGICGTDLHIYNWDSWSQKNVPVPQIIGHEFVGEIVKTGSSAQRFKVGARVSGEGHITCGTCVSCLRGERHLCLNIRGIGYHLPGCFAEYFALKEENVVLLPPEISDDVAAILDPLGNAVHSVLSFDVVGEDVLIVGAGPIGLMASALCRHLGAHSIVITDTNDYRLNIAKQVGASVTVNISHECIPHSNFRVGLEMSGSAEGFNDLLQHMQPGGSVGLLGILPPNTAIDWDLVIFEMLHLKGIYGREIFRTWDKMVRLVQSGLDIMPIITHRFSAEEYQKGIDVLKSKNAAKVILEWK